METEMFVNKLLALQPNMLNFARMLTNNAEKARDLVQDTSLKALDRQDQFVDSTNFKGWVFTIMRNIFINDYHRSMQECVVNDTTDNLYHLNLSQNSGIEAPEDAFDSIEITTLVNTLPADLYEPFMMYVSGYKYQEIAEKLNSPMGTVKTRIRQARLSLQKHIQDYC